MNSIKSIKTTPVPNDVFLKTTKLYYHMGKNEYYTSLFKESYKHISKAVASQDAYAFFKLFFPEYKLQETRFRTLLLDSSVPKNTGEVIYKNIYHIFTMIRKVDADPFVLNVTEINDLVKLIFSQATKEKVQYRRFKTNTHSLLAKESGSMREKLEKLINEFMQIKKEEILEYFKY